MKGLLFLLCAIFSTAFAEDIPLSIADLRAENEATLFENNSPDRFESAFKRMLWILAGIIILIVLTVWMGKRLLKTKIEQTNRISSIKIIEKRPLSPKTMLYLVEIDDKKVLLSESHLEVTKVD